jgi:hypothetical protein
MFAAALQFPVVDDKIIALCSSLFGQPYLSITWRVRARTWSEQKKTF